MIARFVALAIALGAVGTTTRADDPKKPVTREFKVTAASTVTTETNGESMKLAAVTGHRYSWAVTGGERTLRLAEMRVKISADGREKLDIKMSRAGFFGAQDGGTIEREFEKAPDAFKEQLRDSFDAPLCKLEVDESGRETKRTMVAGPGAKAVLASGAIANVTLFHPPYPTKDEWQADAAINSGNGTATGKLTYTKVGGGKNGQQLVKVAGTLKADGVKAGGSTIKEGKYVVSGTQAYDPTVREWVAGRLDVELSVVGVREKQEVTTKGKMALTFELVPEKK